MTGNLWLDFAVRLPNRLRMKGHTFPENLIVAKLIKLCCG